jgi:hypothetical protein
MLRQQILEKERAKQFETQASRAHGQEVMRNAQAHKLMEEQAVIDRKYQQAEYMHSLNSQIGGSRGINRVPSGPNPGTLRSNAVRIVTSGAIGTKAGGKNNSLEDNISAFFGSEGGQDDYRSNPQPYGGQVTTLTLLRGGVARGCVITQ